MRKEIADKKSELNDSYKVLLELRSSTSDIIFVESFAELRCHYHPRGRLPFL